MSGPENGEAWITQNSKIAYTPNSGFVATDSFFYTVSDSREGIDRAIITITINKEEIMVNDVTQVDLNAGQEKVIDTIPQGAQNVQVTLSGDADTTLDLGLDDGNTQIVDWSNGLISGSDGGSTTYAGTKISWSGWGANANGNETISIDDTLNQDLTLLVDAWSSGTGKVEYSWDSGGGSENNNVDLTTDVSLNKSSAQVGEKVNVDIDWNNSNGLDSNIDSDFDYKVYLSDDKTLDGSDQQMASGPEVNGLFGGSDGSYASFKVPSGMNGTKYVLVNGDTNNDIFESNENNNVGVSDKLNISGGQDLPHSDVQMASFLQLDWVDNQEIQNSPYESIGQLRVDHDTGDYKVSMGTGFLVSDKHVVTNAHVLLDDNGNFPSGTEVKFLPGLNGQNATSYSEDESFWNAEHYDTSKPGWPDNDLAIIELDQNIGQTLGSFDIQPNSQINSDQQLISSGYPCHDDRSDDDWIDQDNPHTDGKDFYQWKVTGSLDNQSSGVLDLSSSMTSTPGSSGSPIFYMDNGTPTAVGALAGGDIEQREPKAAAFDADSYGWMNSIVNGNYSSFDSTQSNEIEQINLTGVQEPGNDGIHAQDVYFA